MGSVAALAGPAAQTLLAQFVPHGHCYLWRPDLVSLHVLSDSLIAIAYFSIPVALATFLRRRRDLPFAWVFWLFGLFIVSCGITHVLEVWTLWHPDYWLSGALKALTALVSLYTAFVLWRIMPQALTIPTPTELAALNRQLEEDSQQLRQTSQSLRDELEFSNSLFDQSAIGLACTGPHGRWLRVNARLCDMLGLDRGDLGSLSWGALAAPDAGPEVLDRLRGLDSGSFEDSELEQRLLTRDRGAIDAVLSVRGVRQSSGELKYCLAAVQDVSEKRAALRELEEQRSMYSAVLASISDAVFVADRQGDFTYVCPNVSTIFGYSPAAVAQFSSVSSLLGEDLFEEKQLEEMGELSNIGCSVLDEQGGSHELLVTVKAVAIGAGSRLYTCRDITEIKAAEQRLLQAKQRLEESNEELQEFAYVASHDLQEPLRKILAFGERLQSACADRFEDREADYLKRMMSAALRSRELINDLLTFSRVQTKARPLEPTDLAAVVDGVLSDLEIAIESSGAEVDVGPLPHLDADANQMRQLFQNLLSNAIKFRRADVAPHIQISSRSLSGPGPQRCEISVSDNGIGFEARYAEAIFMPFKRLHGRQAYEGSGIGLAICRKIARRHSGTLVAQSSPDQGSTFTLQMPVHAATPISS
ncbi:PAS domain S-box protein [Synechococcus sp. RSCCF101]|uniref:sensor histidine kinase n=1 Tax=Synechococcus sp. RSCCF101 TaxID=2511069 RepID=UPI001247A5DB|nr:ATP-binding protein [Synechococcus sp. RSCCF101]QEY30905.1 PAS domain S-box protein [Synechococcus sp. RSCCF101]